MNRNFKTIFALSMCAVLTIGLSTIASCSADEDYSAFAGDELETLAEGDMRMGQESNTITQIEFNNKHEFLLNLKENCGSGGCSVWCIGYLMDSHSYLAENYLLSNANAIKSDWKTLGLDGYEIIQLAHTMNIHLDSLISYKYAIGNDTIIDQVRVKNKILALKQQSRISNCIISIGTNHWMVAKNIYGQVLDCYDVNHYFQSYDNNGNGNCKYDIDNVTELIYH